MLLSPALFVPLAAVLMIPAVLILHRWLFRFARLALRTLAGALLLQILALLGQPFGITFGVNLFNALVLGWLGVPGFGLLLFLSWTVSPAFPASFISF